MGMLGVFFFATLFIFSYYFHSLCPLRTASISPFPCSVSRQVLMRRGRAPSAISWAIRAGSRFKKTKKKRPRVSEDKVIFAARATNLPRNIPLIIPTACLPACFPARVMLAPVGPIVDYIPTNCKMKAKSPTLIPSETFQIFLPGLNISSFDER